MATSRSSLPKSMTPFAKKPAAMGSDNPNPFAKANKAKPKFAEGGAITVGSGKEATPGALPKAGRKVKPTGGGTMRGAGAATKGKHFQGTF